MKTKHIRSGRKPNLWPAIPLGITLVVLGGSLRSPPQSALASSTSGVQLGTAGTYSVLAGTTITNTGATTLAGDLGLSPGTSVTGFPPGIVDGTANITNSAAQTAETDTTSAYREAAGMTPATTEVADLAGLTLSPGIYAVPAGTSNLTGTLTLNGQGNPNAVFVFQLPSTLITSSSSNIVLTNSANPCNVFWQVTSSATLGTSSVFKGTILALTSITANTSATIDGRLLARNGAVTLESNTITNPVCTTSTTTTPPATTTTTPPTTTITPSPLTISTGPLSPPASHTDALPVGLAIGGIGLAGLGYLFIERKRRLANGSSNEVA